MSIPTDFHGLPGISCDNVLSFGCVAWKSKQEGQFFTISSMSAFMLIQQMDSCASSLVFSGAMWFRCSCFSTLSCSDAGIIILLPVIVTFVLAKEQDRFHEGSECDQPKR